MGQAVLGGYPEPAAGILGNAFHGVAGQSVVGGVGLEPFLAIPSGTAIQSVAVAAQPKGAVARLAESLNLLQNAALRVVELIGRLPVTGEATVAPRPEIDLHHALQTAHEELLVAGDEAADAARNAWPGGQGLREPTLGEIVEKEPRVGAHPQAAVQGVYGQGSDEIERTGRLWAYVQWLDGPALLQVGRADAAAPGTNP